MLDLTPRDTVRSYLSSMNPDNAEAWATTVFDHSRRFENISRDDLEEILLEEMETACRHEQLLAALLILNYPRRGPTTTTAIRKFETALISSDERLIENAATALLGIQALPKELVAPIERLLSHHSSVIQRLAATIGIRFIDLQEKSEPILLNQLDILPPLDQFNTAIALIRSGKHARVGWKTLDGFETGRPKEEFFNGVLTSLAWINESRHSVEHLIGIVDDVSLTIETRALATRLLGYAGRTDATVRRKLLDCLRATHWQLVYSAADALGQQSPPENDEAISILIGHLEDPNVALRETAASVLRTCFPAPTRATAQRVIEKMVFERDLEVLSLRTRFCVAASDVAVAPLLNAIEQSTGLRQVVLYCVIPNLGESAAQPLIEEMAHATSEPRRGLLAGLLMNMQMCQGSLAVSLREMLSSTDPNECRMALTAIANTGRAAETLTPEILQAIDTWDIQMIQNLGFNAIESIGPAALPYLDSYPARNPALFDHIRTRLESRGRTKGEHELSWIENTKLLRIYVLVATLLDEKPASFPTLAAILEQRQEGGEVARDLGVSKRNLDISIKQLEAELSDRWSREVSLMTYEKRKWKLTQEGRRVLRLAKSFLKAIG